jgi:hypothetical protein
MRASTRSNAPRKCSHSSHVAVSAGSTQHSALIERVADAHAFDVQQVTDDDRRERLLFAEVSEKSFLDRMAIEAKRDAEEVAAAAHLANRPG